MFYYLVAPILMYNGILVAAAVIPAIFLLVRVYRADRLDKESPYLLWDLIKGGIFSALIALVLEKIGSWVLGMAAGDNQALYDVLLYFVVVAMSEEGAKYFMLHRRSWNNREFNCQFDGVVYAVFTSLGFAIWENISYVLTFGFSAAVIRALTAIPGHACFGVFMGVFYGIAKKYDNAGDKSTASIFKVLTFVVPVLMHGAYDYIASVEQLATGWYFWGFIAVLFVITYILVGKAAQKDTYI